MLDKHHKKAKKQPVSISILMPVYNVEKYLRIAIESLYKSSFLDFEILIIDDGSEDDTLKIAKQLEKEFPKIKVFANQKNLGVGKSLNKLLKQAQGKYITRLDGDDTVHKDRLLKQFRLLEETMLGCCGTNLAFMDKKGNLFEVNRYTNYDVPSRFSAAFINPIPNATLMYRMDIIKKYNLVFPPLTVAEDYGFFLQYLKFSDAIMINEPLYNYRILDDSLSHINSDLSIKKGRELCNEYVEKISPGSSTTLTHQFMTAFNPKPIYNAKLLNNTFAEDIKKIIFDFKKYYNFSNDEEIKCYLFIAQLAAERANYAHEIYELSNLPLFRRFIRFYRLNGVKKTFKKIPKYIKKKIIS